MGPRPAAPRLSWGRLAPWILALAIATYLISTLQQSRDTILPDPSTPTAQPPPPPPRHLLSTMVEPTQAAAPAPAPAPASVLINEWGLPVGSRALHVEKFSIEDRLGLCGTVSRAHKAKETHSFDALTANMTPKWVCGNSSLGNMLSLYFHFRAVAEASGLAFSMGEGCPGSGANPSVQAFLPRVSPAPPATHAPQVLGGLEGGLAVCAKCWTYIAHACPTGWTDNPHIVVKDLRSALTLWAARNERALAKVEWDDVAIHVRCGDLFGIKNAHVGSQYGLLHYSHYLRIIPKNVTSIGILTQSLNRNCGEWANRPGDCKFVSECTYVVNHLAAFLRERFPGVRITIRDGEAVGLVYYRMVFAPVATICNPSTFCLWPTLASNNGHLPMTKLFPHAHKAARQLPNVEVIPKLPEYLSYKTLKMRIKRLDFLLDAALMPPAEGVEAR